MAGLCSSISVLHSKVMGSSTLDQVLCRPLWLRRRTFLLPSLSRQPAVRITGNGSCSRSSICDFDFDLVPFTRAYLTKPCTSIRNYPCQLCPHCTSIFRRAGSEIVRGDQNLSASGYQASSQSWKPVGQRQDLAGWGNRVVRKGRKNPLNLHRSREHIWLSCLNRCSSNLCA